MAEFDNFRKRTEKEKANMFDMGARSIVEKLLPTIDNFETNDFMRLMGLAKDISTNLAGEVIIGFPDYNELKHQNKISQVKQGFQDAPFTKTVTVVNYMMA